MTTQHIYNYLSLVKFSHTIFAMPFAIVGFFMGIYKGNHSFDYLVLIYVLLCMVFARNAAMSFNRYVDRDIDSVNPRTSSREIPKGIVRAKSVLIFSIVNSLLFILTTFFINEHRLAFYLSPIALFIVLGYSFTKKFTVLCHFILGIGLSLAPIGGYIAVTGKFHFLPLIFSAAVLFWVSGFDIIYALQDQEFDIKHNLRSIPAKIGKSKALFLARILHFLSSAFIISGGFVGNFGFFYWLGSMFYIGLLVYQHLLVKPNDLSKINLAFFTTNGVASVIFAVFCVVDMVYLT